MTVDVSVHDFTERVLQSPIPVLVDFHAPWCGPCKAIEPEIDRLATEYQGKAVVAKVDIAKDGNEQLANRYQVRGIPTMLVFNKGQVVDMLTGTRPVEDISDSLKGVCGIRA